MEVGKVLEIVELKKQIEEERREPTPEELETLSGWMGWGAVAPAFEKYPKEEWREVGAQLHLLLGPEGAKAAQEATPSSYFTDRYIVDLLWLIARDLGFTGGQVLEPGCGSGAFMAAAPLDLPLHITGIERDPFSADIARLRCPGANIITSPLEKVSLVEGAFDLVIGNVPFADVRMYDKHNGGWGYALHNYFIYRALTALRRGGLATLLTSRYTLDAQRELQRDVLASQATLLGA
ncbi:MAG: class I SAM-dependent methyltransferase, partial [Ktedonobacteraceae bacterium]|nr:class I SAM-dependent methyltransferase [Ktedonobacteraceae bacterium]